MIRAVTKEQLEEHMLLKEVKLPEFQKPLCLPALKKILYPLNFNKTVKKNVEITILASDLKSMRVTKDKEIRKQERVSRKARIQLKRMRYGHDPLLQIKSAQKILGKLDKDIVEWHKHVTERPVYFHDGTEYNPQPDKKNVFSARHQRVPSDDETDKEKRNRICTGAKEVLESKNCLVKFRSTQPTKSSSEKKRKRRHPNSVKPLIFRRTLTSYQQTNPSTPSGLKPSLLNTMRTQLSALRTEETTKEEETISFVPQNDKSRELFKECEKAVNRFDPTSAPEGKWFQKRHINNNNVAKALGISTSSGINSGILKPPQLAAPGSPSSQPQPYFIPPGYKTTAERNFFKHKMAESEAARKVFIAQQCLLDEKAHLTQFSEEFAKRVQIGYYHQKDSKLEFRITKKIFLAASKKDREGIRLENSL